MQPFRRPAPSNAAAVDGAECLAVAVLAYVAADADSLSRFLSLSGVSPQGLRRAAAEPDFLRGVLEFVLDHEPLLLSFCANANATPQSVADARRQLGG